MQSPAERRRGQASVEWLAITLIAAAVIISAAVAIGSTDAVPAVARRLTGEVAPSPAGTLALGEALSGHAGAISIAGAQAWLAESLGADAADQQVRAAIVSRLSLRHRAWLADLTIRTLPSRSGTRRVIARGTGAISIRLVTASDEARFALVRTTPSDRATAAAVALGWDGAGAVAGRIARPLGLALSALHLVANLTADDPPQPAGTRADDILICRTVDVLTITRTTQSSIPRGRGWRVGVLRHDQLILDTITFTSNPCAGSASHERPAEPSRNYG